MINFINRKTRINKYKLSDGKEYVYRFASYSFDYLSMLLYRDGKKQKITFKEAELLKLFCVNSNKILTREFILNTIWGNDDYYLGRCLDVFISKLRKYLKDDTEVKIVTIRTRGFKLEVKE